MITSKDLELVKQLTEATQKGRVSWHPTAVVNEFTSSFKGRFNVLVGKYEGGSSYVRMTNEDGNEMMNIDGRQEIDQLWELVRRMALQVDHAIEDILQELKQA